MGGCLAASSTLTDAAGAYDVHRVTIYRWMKSSTPFAAAQQRARAESVPAGRDDLHQLRNRPSDAILAVLDNPKSSPAVLPRTAMVSLQRPQLPKDRLVDARACPRSRRRKAACLGYHRTGLRLPDGPASAASELRPAPESPVPPASDVTGCNRMQHDFENSDDVVPPRRPPAKAAPAPCPLTFSRPATITRNTLRFTT